MAREMEGGNGKGGVARARRADLHFDRAVASAADELIRDEVDAVDFVSVPRQVGFELVRFQVPDLEGAVS